MTSGFYSPMLKTVLHRAALKIHSLAEELNSVKEYGELPLTVKVFAIGWQ
jgi:hypothetical protein